MALDPSSAKGGVPARLPGRLLLAWFLGLVAAEAGPPLRLHLNAKRAVEPGSRLGSPALSPEFRAWLGRSDKQRAPARAAMARLHGAPVREGLPRLDATLGAIAATRDLTLAGAVLARAGYPSMADPPTALAHAVDALVRFSREWSHPYRRRLTSPCPEERSTTMPYSEPSTDRDEHSYLTVAEAADRLRVHENSIRAWIHDGKLPAVRIGTGTGRLRVLAADLDRLLRR